MIDEIIKVNIGCTYTDRYNTILDIIKIYGSPDNVDEIAFEIAFKGREEDTIEIYFKIDELFHSLGKALNNHIKEMGIL